jgi:hypothetical protein
MLVRKYTPQQICHALKLCPHHESTSLGAQHWEQYCFVCEFVTQIIEGYLQLAIQWILRNEPPKALCQQIGFCRRGDKINTVQKFRVN